MRLSRHVWRKAARLRTMQAGDAARGKRAWAGWPQDRTMDKPKQERRNEARRRALKGARIVFGRHNALIDCTVSNLSDRGARLKVESPIGIPRECLCDIDRRFVHVSERAAFRCGSGERHRWASMM